MGTAIKNIFGLLIPPADSSPERINAWRTAVFVALLAISLVLVGHISQTTGWLGIESQWAKESELDQLRAEVKIMSRRNLESDLLNSRIRQCRAMSANNTDAARYAGELLQSLRLEYLGTHGHSYPLPTCREAGVDDPV